MKITLFKTIAAMLCCGLLVSGCTFFQNNKSSVILLSRTIGVAAGEACNMTKMTAQTKAAIVDIMKVASATIPDTNSTFAATWPAVAQGILDPLVATGKLTAAESAMAKTAVS